MKFLEFLTTQGIVSAATGAGAIFLLAKTIIAGIKSPPYKPQQLTLARLAIEHQSKNMLDSKELRGLLCNLDSTLDDYSKNMILHGITRSVYLLDKEASACTFEDIKLIASFLDDPDTGIKIQTLRALKAFTGIWKFSIRVQCGQKVHEHVCVEHPSSLLPFYLTGKDIMLHIFPPLLWFLFLVNCLQRIKHLWPKAEDQNIRKEQKEFVPKVLQIVTNIWDNDIHVAGLRLLNALQLPDQTHTLLKKLMPALMEILQMGSTLAQVQVIKFLSMLAQKEDLLFDIMNCQVHGRFLSLFQTSRPGNVLFELLVFVERLCEGRLTPQYQSVPRQYNESSLHEVLFGEGSRLSDHLLSLIIHPEEEVQIQACRVVLKFQLYEEGDISGIHNCDTSLSETNMRSNVIENEC